MLFSFCSEYKLLTYVLFVQPKSWIPAGDLIGEMSVSALDMLSGETSIHRLLTAINQPSKLAPIRPWCMQCKTPNGVQDKLFHCHHCGRHVCGHCARRGLEREFFPKSFSISDVALVCIVCEDILVSRKEEDSNSTGITNPTSSFLAEDDEFSSDHQLHLI